MPDSFYRNLDDSRQLCLLRTMHCPYTGESKLMVLPPESGELPPGMCRVLVQGLELWRGTIQEFHDSSTSIASLIHSKGVPIFDLRREALLEYRQEEPPQEGEKDEIVGDHD